MLGGGFGATFHFHEHPNCVVTAATDLYEGRRQRLRDHYKVDAVYNSFDEMMKARKSFDAVAIFSGAPVRDEHAEIVRRAIAGDRRSRRDRRGDL